MGRLGRLVFPPEPRHFRGRRSVKILLRAAHVLSAGVFVGAVLFQVEAARSEPWMHATLVSGALVLLLDLHESAAFLLQVRGLVVLGKLAVLALLPFLGGFQVLALSGLLALSVLSSHTPSEIRHHLVVGRGRIRGGHSRG